MELGNVDGALGEYDKAIAADPEDPHPYQYKANLLAWDIGDFDAALDVFAQCLDVEPGMPWCLIDLAWLYDHLGQTENAVDSFQLFIENVNPEDCPECVEEAQQYIDQNS